MSPTASADERAPLLAGNESSSEAANPLLFSTRQKAVILVSTWTVVFLGALDTTIVATLVGPISSSFNAGNQASWLGTSFLATLAGCTPAYGRLSDIFGRRFSILTALSLFTLGTAGCGTSTTMLRLNIWRAVAGSGAGGLMVMSSIIASDLMPLKKRGLIQGFANMFYGVGSALGGPLGGWISESINWRAAFYLQVPVLVVAAILIFSFVRYEPPSKSDKKPGLARVDWLGMITVLFAVAGLLVGLSFMTNNDKPVSDPRVWGPGLVFVVFLAAFVYSESHVCKEPILPVSLMLAKSPRYTLLVNFLTSAAGFSILYYYPLFQQAVLHQSSAQAGTHLIPNSVALSAGSLLAGWIMRRTGRFWWLTLASATAPLLGLIPFTQLTLESAEWQKWLDIMPIGLGLGSATTSALIALISGVDRSEMAVATAASYLLRYTGQVTGVAASGALLQWRLTRALRSLFNGPGSEELIERIRKSSSVIPELPMDVRVKAELSYERALHSVFWFSALLVLLAALCSLQIEERPLPGSPEEEEENRRKQQDGTTE